MKSLPFQKYKPSPPLNFPERTWPSKHITKAPIWCSVDLRDGNQALIEPMSINEKIKFYQKLVEIGFNEIEIGFPSASNIEYDFTRFLIEENKIPNNLSIQILCQAREKLIEKSIESIKGAKKAIFHLYNSTSTTQRKVVFNKDKKAIMEIAVAGTKYVKEQLAKIPNVAVQYQYSPESFTQTELDYALEVCEAVIDVWKPTKKNNIIINLPATVETSTPNIYADKIEWFLNNLRDRDKVILSLHPHNDRGTAIAATELALMAGADRVEGTLFGNGERTGNVDLAILALNLFSQGVNPKLDFTKIDKICKVVTECNKLPISARHPYVGSLVYTAFSGSHQDAINKGMKELKKNKKKNWDVPYLPINPTDLGRKYEPIRINSQSGKGGVTYILEKKYNFKLPRELSIQFSKIVQAISEKTKKEVQPLTIYNSFLETYSCDYPLKLLQFQVKNTTAKVECNFSLEFKDKKIKIKGSGNGAIDAFVSSMKKLFNLDFKTTDYQEHTLGLGSNADSICYYQIAFKKGQSYYGIGINSDIIKASFLAVVSAINCYSKKTKITLTSNY